MQPVSMCEWPVEQPVSIRRRPVSYMQPVNCYAPVAMCGDPLCSRCRCAGDMPPWRVVKGVGHLDHVWSYGVREVVSSIPDRGNIVGWVFHPTRWLVKFSHLNMLSFKILNLFRTLSSCGSSNYRPSAPFLYEVANHIKNCHSGH